MSNPVSDIEQVMTLAGEASKLIGAFSTLQTVDLYKEGHPTVSDIKTDIGTAVAAIKDAITKTQGLVAYANSQKK